MERKCDNIQERLLSFPSVFILAAALFFLLLRAPYGWCFNDEPFIVTLAQRLYMGDRMILDEWHPAQVFGPVILPFYFFFRLFSPDNTGILLAFRYSYCALWWGTCFAVFCVIKKHYHSTFTALCVFAYLVLFSPLDYMTLSYTSIGLMSCLLISCLILEIQDSTKTNITVYSVVFSVCAVVLILCSPYMAGIYFLTLIIAFWKQKNALSSGKNNFFRIVRWSSCCSIIFFVIILLGFVVRKGENWKTYSECIQMVLADPEHPNTSIIKRIIQCLEVLVNKNWPFSTLIGISIGCSFYRKGLKKCRLVLFLICVCGYLYAVYSYLNNEVYAKFNQQMIDVAVLGIAAFALLEDKPWDLFFSFTVTGLIYTFMNNLASNTGIYSVGMTLTVCGVGSIVYIVRLCQELKKQYPGRKRLRFFISLICVGIMMTQLSSELFTRIIRQYWDEEPSALTETIQVGAAKGLKTTSARKEEYEQQYEELKTLLDAVKDKGNMRFVSFTANPIIYLDADLKFGTFTAWTFSHTDSYMSYLEKYEEIVHHSKENIYYISNQKDLPNSFPTEHYQKLSAGESIAFIPRGSVES